VNRIDIVRSFMNFQDCKFLYCEILRIVFSCFCSIMVDSGRISLSFWVSPILVNHYFMPISIDNVDKKIFTFDFGYPVEIFY
jgi:hypothetical protein